MRRRESDQKVTVRRAAVLSVSTETVETDDIKTGRPRYVTDVKVWASLAAARDPGQLHWDPVTHSFVMVPELEPEPEPTPENFEEKEEEDEDEEEDEEAVEETEEETPAAKKKKKEKKEKPKKEKKKKQKIKKKKKKKKTSYVQPTGPLIYAKPRQISR